MRWARTGAFAAKGSAAAPRMTPRRITPGKTSLTYSAKKSVQRGCRAPLTLNGSVTCNVSYSMVAYRRTHAARPFSTPGKMAAPIWPPGRMLRDAVPVRNTVDTISQRPVHFNTHIRFETAGIIDLLTVKRRRDLNITRVQQVISLKKLR
ncbi:unnamed protein product [Euphydryas editha]|uniref:Uncharacterized protein n=1 Tax=Euphydryas editha TaxID=104508 RepID=A0AAU9V6R0_EUPED|nr:unnamed protein product [Euphydryas editha]